MLVDGSIDWLDENKDDAKGFIEEPAKKVAELYRRQNLDWLASLQGSFALVICDRNESKVHLIRDKLGTKPIYYALGKPRILMQKIVGDSYFIIDDAPAQTSVEVAKGILTSDGHCTVSPDGEWILTDGYTDSKNRLPLFLWNLQRTIKDQYNLLIGSDYFNALNPGFDALYYATLH